MTSYIALIRKDQASDFGVDFPDFPGCVTAGVDLDESRRLAAEALDLHIAGMVEDGELIPQPSTLDAIMSDPHNRDGVACLIDVATGARPAMRINITLPAEIIEAIDRVAHNRSRFLAEAAREKLRA